MIINSIKEYISRLASGCYSIQAPTRDLGDFHHLFIFVFFKLIISLGVYIASVSSRRYLVIKHSGNENESVHTLDMTTVLSSSVSLFCQNQLKKKKKPKSMETQPKKGRELQILIEFIIVSFDKDKCWKMQIDMEGSTVCSCI